MDVGRQRHAPQRSKNSSAGRGSRMCHRSSARGDDLDRAAGGGDLQRRRGSACWRAAAPVPRSPPSARSRKISTRPPLGLRPNSRAGSTRVSLNTSRSPRRSSCGRSRTRRSVQRAGGGIEHQHAGSPRAPPAGSGRSVRRAAHRQSPGGARAHVTRRGRTCPRGAGCSDERWGRTRQRVQQHHGAAGRDPHNKGPLQRSPRPRQCIIRAPWPRQGTNTRCPSGGIGRRSGLRPTT